MANGNGQQTPPCESCIKNDITELEHTLHQQFAENYNNISGSLMAFVAAMFIVFTGYAYVFSNIKDAPCIFNCLGEPTEGTYSINALFWANLMLNLTMLAVFYISVNLGVTQRKEQFITYTIRRNAYGAKNKYELNTNIFPKGYHPFRKTPCNYLIGIYGYIAKCAFWTSILVSAVTLMYIICVNQDMPAINSCCYFKNCCHVKLCCFVEQYGLSIIHAIVSGVIILGMLIYKGFCKYLKYHEYENEYKGKLGIKD